MTKGYVEETDNLIYRRILEAFGAELARRGLEIFLVKPSGFSQKVYSNFLKAGSGTVYFSESESNLVQAPIPGLGAHNFEDFPGKLVFLHLDAILTSPRCSSFESGLSLLQAWTRVANRSLHLCLEPNDAQALRDIGIENVALIPHATEIQATEPCSDTFDHGVSFVGHILPSKDAISSGSKRVDDLVVRLLQRRMADFSAPLCRDIAEFAEDVAASFGKPGDNRLSKLAHVQWLRRQVGIQSLRFRGAIVETGDLGPLDIIGGDPAYLYGSVQSRVLEQANVLFYPPVYELTALQKIYRNSRICINFSSPQFDYAVPNRIHDVFMSGGLCLTDQRDGLADLTSHHAEISYRTLGHLRELIHHYTNPKNSRARALLIRAIQQDIAKNSGYALWCDQVERFIARN